MSNSSNLRVAVIGGGPGGYAAAFLAADLGMQVTLIDPEVNPGGVCLYRGCIPSKGPPPPRPPRTAGNRKKEAKKKKTGAKKSGDPKAPQKSLGGRKEGAEK